MRTEVKEDCHERRGMDKMRVTEGVSGTVTNGEMSEAVTMEENSRRMMEGVEDDQDVGVGVEKDCYEMESMDKKKLQIGGVGL